MKLVDLRRMLCIGLILVTLLGAVGCAPISASDPSTQPSTPTGIPTQPASVPTEPATVPPEPIEPATEPPTEPTEPTTPPTEPTEPPEPMLDPALPLFELTQADVDEFYRLLEEAELLAMAGEDMDAIDAATQALDAQYEFISTQCSISMILHYSDESNDMLEAQYLSCYETYSQANKAYILMSRRVYESDSPAKEELFKDWTEQDLAQLLAYEEEIALLQERNASIEVEYMNATTDEERIRLYIELIQNNNQIAQTFGYENYYTYAYSLVYNRDYFTDELEQMRQYARTYLIDAVDEAYANFMTSFRRELPEYKQNQLVSFLYMDYTSIYPNYVEYHLSRMPESMQTHMNAMLTSDSYFTTLPTAMEGAFTTMIGDRSYCFFGPGYGNNCTVMHEAGHYYASRYTDLNSLPLDLAETHSQGSEWLFVCNLQGKMVGDLYKAMVDYRLYDDIVTILTCLMIDEFEQRVYSADVSNFTAADFDAIMDSVLRQYCTADFADDYLLDISAYWRQVVVLQSVYYISYAVSSVASLDLYTMAVEDFDSAVAVYQSLCEEPLEEAGFLGNITAAGLSGPFQEEFYIELVELINSRT